jgi:uncharacterized membrane protein
VVALVTKEKHCVMHSGREMILLLAKKLTTSFGVTVDDNHVSTNAKHPRK